MHLSHQNPEFSFTLTEFLKSEEECNIVNPITPAQKDISKTEAISKTELESNNDLQMPKVAIPLRDPGLPEAIFETEPESD